MLNFVYYPVSFVLWCWHWLFGHLLGDSNAIGWALSIVFLVFTLRLILVKPMVHQVRSMRKMQEFAPEMKKLQKKYANDRQRQAQEMQRLQREHGVNPLGGCLPMLLQIPVFIGLNHVLRGFSPASTTNYFFGQHDVQSYLNAKLLGAHLDDAVFGIGKLAATPGFHWNIAPMALPLMIAGSVMTHLTARLSVRRQLTSGTPGTPQTEMMNKLSLYLLPLGLLAFGAGFQVGLLLYFVSNNVWNFFQQRFVFARMDLEEQKKKEQAVESRQALAPKPGQKPAQARKRPAGSSPAKPAGGPSDGKQQNAAKPRTIKSGTAKANGAAGSTAGTPGVIYDRSQRKKQDRKRG